MSIILDGSNKDSYFEKEVEDEWKTCVYQLNRLPNNVWRYRKMKRYWEDRIKALVPVIYSEDVHWLKILESRYPSGVDYQTLLNEM